jgi:hypothetical protein
MEKAIRCSFKLFSKIFSSEQVMSCGEIFEKIVLSIILIAVEGRDKN